MRQTRIQRRQTRNKIKTFNKGSTSKESPRKGLELTESCEVPKSSFNVQIFSTDQQRFKVQKSKEISPKTCSKGLHKLVLNPSLFFFSFSLFYVHGFCNLTLACVQISFCLLVLGFYLV
ncbi:hypothetical protein Fmac_018210 [Flemingia macrophylla]|uniref:Uncharacterized protein n=1 Tax=Flemingia macrophylla TaxID=520843 RepID=A0ABD1M4C7_9FABA